MVNEKTQNKVLKFIQDCEGTANKGIADAFDLSESRVSKIVGNLYDKDFISKKKSGRTNILEITEQGVKFLEESDPHPPEEVLSITDEEQHPWTVRAHNCSARAELKDSCKLPINWIESYYENGEKDFKETSDGYITQIKGIKCRFTDNYVIVYLPHVEGQDVVNVKNKVNEIAREKVNTVVNNSPAKIVDSSLKPTFKLRKQEIALMDDPFAETCVSSDEINLQEQKFRDSNGELRFHIDNSNGTPELEFVSSKYGEVDADFYREEVLGELIENKDDWRDLFGKAKNDEFDEMKSLLNVLIKLITADKLEDLGQDSKKDTESNRELSEAILNNLESDTEHEKYCSKRQGSARREEGNGERWERLNKLEEKMEERLKD